MILFSDNLDKMTVRNWIIILQLFVCVHLLDKGGFVQSKLNHFYMNWRFGVQCLI